MGGRLKNFSLKRFHEHDEDAYDVSRQSAFFRLPIIFVGRIWRTSHRIKHSQTHYRLSTMARPPIPLLVSQYEHPHFLNI